MDGFDAVKMVTGGATLAALVVLAILAGVRAALTKDAELLKEVGGTPDEVASRERVAMTVLEKFHIDTANMKGADKKELALAQLTERRKRLTAVLWFLVALAGIGAVVSVVALVRSGGHETSSVTTQVTGSGGNNVVGSGNSIVNLSR